MEKEVDVLFGLVELINDEGIPSDATYRELKMVDKAITGFKPITAVGTERKKIAVLRVTAALEAKKASGPDIGDFLDFLDGLMGAMQGNGGPHMHQCAPCNLVWEHDTTKINNEHDYMLEHLCPGCGTDIRFKAEGLTPNVTRLGKAQHNPAV